MRYYTPPKRPLFGKRKKRIIGSFQSKHKLKMQRFFSMFTEVDARKRLFALVFSISFIVILFVIRLFYLQIIHGEEYLALAKEQQYGKIIIPAKRGEILTENSKTGEINKFATNVTLNLVYIDPKEVLNKAKVSKDLAPILFDEEDFLACKEDLRKCPNGLIKFEDSQILLSKNIESDSNNKEDLNETKEEVEKIKDTRTKDQLILDYENDLFEKISKKEVDYSPLLFGANDEIMDKVEKMRILGVNIIRNKNLIYADPTHVDQTQVKKISKDLADVLKISWNDVKKLITRREIRYIPLKRRLSIDASDAIWKLKIDSYNNHKKDTINIPHYFKGVVLLPEHWRYYPEKNLASTVIGYIDNEGIGRYGIEEKFDEILRGKEGELLSQNDVQGEQLVFDVSKMTNAIDGDSIILTIDRVIQKKVQELLEASVKRYRADNGTIIVSDPFTGKILAMGNYPNFDPNNFGEVYKLAKTEKKDWKFWGTEQEIKGDIYPTQPYFIKDEKGNYEEVKYNYIQEEEKKIIEAKRKKLIDDKVEIPEKNDKYVYKNRFGLAAYVNRANMTLYEPGSVFKPIAMAIGLDSGEVKPNDTYMENGPVEIDTGTGEKQYIHTALNVYRGKQTMTNILEYSSNVGMAFVARKLGKELFYRYIIDFGFGDYTYIDLVGEQKGKVTFWKKWPEAQLLTTSFGQGIAVTPIQMIQAWGALANGGLLMQPQIVSAFLKPDGTRIDVNPKIIRRVISKETSEQITAMMVFAVDNGVAKQARINGYKIAGKTGTSQMACSDSYRCSIGKYEKGDGTTVTSFAGYTPISKPKFLIFVKFERPRIGYNTWGATTASPVFRELAEFLLKYYDIPPDDV